MITPTDCNSVAICEAVGLCVTLACAKTSKLVNDKNTAKNTAKAFLPLLM